MINLLGFYFNFWILLALSITGFFVSAWWIRYSLKCPRTLLFSNVKSLIGNVGIDYSSIPGWLFCISFILLSLAMIDPHTYKEKEEGQSDPFAATTEGIGIYLVLDKSGSMGAEITTPGGSGRRDKQTKLSLLKEVTTKFVKERPSDLVGVVTFARQADVAAPLTLDHESVKQAIGEIEQVPSREMDGTAIGYAIYKTVSLINATKKYTEDADATAAFEIKSNVIILVTDGLQDPNPLDQGNKLRTLGLEEAAEFAKEMGVKLYIVNVEPKLATARYEAQRNQLERITELTGGKFYIVDSPKELERVYSAIDSLEKSTLPDISKEYLPQYYKRINFYPALLIMGLVLLFIAIIFRTLIVRRIP